MTFIAVRLLSLTAVLLVTSFNPGSLFAEELDGITLPDSYEVNGKSLVLNGLGIRKATIFGIRVYVAGLYVTKKCADPELLLNSPDPKYILMQMVRTITREDIVDAWTSGLEKNVENPQPFIVQLNAVTSPLADIQPGEKIGVLFEQNAVQLETPGNRKFRVNGKGFGKALLSIWLGENPPNRALKRGLLGNP